MLAAAAALALAEDGVNLVDEDDRRRVPPRELEQHPHLEACDSIQNSPFHIRTWKHEPWPTCVSDTGDAS